MSDDSINRDNRYLTLLDFELNPTLMSWIQRCSSLKPDDIEHHSRAYRELDAERLEIIAFFSRPLEEICIYERISKKSYTTNTIEKYKKNSKRTRTCFV